MSECFWKHNSLNEIGTEGQLVNGYISTFLRIALSKSAVVLIYEVDPLFAFFTKLHQISLLSFLFSSGCQSMERNLKASVCTHSKRKPVVHEENSKKSQA